MVDQAAELRQRMRQHAAHDPSFVQEAPLVVVSGGKRGVGTTTVAVNLAVALARHGRRAVLVDGNLEHADCRAWCHDVPQGCIADVLAGRRGVHEVLERGPSGIQMLVGAPVVAKAEYPPGEQDRFVNELKQLAPHADVVVVDAGSARTHFVRRLWRAAAAVIVVTTTEAPAVMNAYAAIKTLARAETPLATHTLVNQVDDADLADDIQTRIIAACRKFLALRTTAGGWVPPHPAGDAGHGSHVFAARSDAGRALDRLADTLWAQLRVSAARQAAARRADEAAFA